MNAKKHPKANLENYSKLFAQLGLVLTLAIVYMLIQSKTFAKDVIAFNTSGTVIDDHLESNIVYEVEIPEPKPIQKKVFIDVITKVDDETDLPEAIFENIDPETPVEVDDIIEIEPTETIVEDVPFTILEDAPVFPGCEGTKEEKKACFTEEVRRFVGKKFNSDLASTLGLSPGIQRISVLFKIDKNGDIVDVQARAPHIKLKEEAIRVINSLPKMEPGKQRGVPVNVKYAIPIVFKIE